MLRDAACEQCCCRKSTAGTFRHAMQQLLCFLGVLPNGGLLLHEGIKRGFQLHVLFCVVQDCRPLAIHQHVAKLRAPVLQWLQRSASSSMHVMQHVSNNREVVQKL